LRIRPSQADLRFLTEDEARIAAHVAADAQDLLTLTVCTGLQFGEVTALWCRDIDLEHGTVRVNKAWTRDGEDGETETPPPDGSRSSCGPSRPCVDITSATPRPRNHAAPSRSPHLTYPSLKTP